MFNFLLIVYVIHNIGLRLSFYLLKHKYYMRLTFIILSSCVLLSSCLNKKLTNSNLDKNKTNYSITAEKAFLEINPKTTRAELTQIAQQFLDKKNIVVDFSKSTFNKKGFIQDVNLSVDCNDGMKGSTTSSRALLRINSVGFIRDYRVDSKVPFAIGDI